MAATGNSSMSSGGNRNTRQISPAVHWCFTLNNPNLPEDALQFTGHPRVLDYVIQEEVGESGTHHLQGYLRFKSKVRPLSLFKTTAIHWEKTRSIEASKAYCSDAEKRKPGGQLWQNCLPEPIIDYLDGKELYPWQLKVTNILKEERDPRTIHWIWEPIGRTGKSSFARHLIIKQEPCTVTFVTGSAKDVKYAISQMKEVPKAVLVDYVRSQENFISYQMLEEVKNGLFFSPKYEAAMKVFNPPHLIIFANFPPEFTKLSLDRWKVWKIIENDLVEDLNRQVLL